MTPDTGDIRAHKNRSQFTTVYHRGRNHFTRDARKLCRDCSVLKTFTNKRNSSFVFKLGCETPQHSYKNWTKRGKKIEWISYHIARSRLSFPIAKKVLSLKLNRNRNETYKKKKKKRKRRERDSRRMQVIDPCRVLLDALSTYSTSTTSFAESLGRHPTAWWSEWGFYVFEFGFRRESSCVLFFCRSLTSSQNSAKSSLPRRAGDGTEKPSPWVRCKSRSARRGRLPAVGRRLRTKKREELERKLTTRHKLELYRK